MTVHAERINGPIDVLRFYPPGLDYATGDDYDGVVIVRWLSPHAAELLAAAGRRGASGLSEAVAHCVAAGAREITALRGPGHEMPPPWAMVGQSGAFSRWRLEVCGS
ncbi:hypothetical protein [Methylomonas sp. CM2]|uniref:hypothetical protein n=1 Tax=Methylomonas sp. CM2 TaxID=3417647 RepID=UPI003CED9313